MAAPNQFTTTRWPLALAATRRDDPAGSDALARLCGRYSSLNHPDILTIYEIGKTTGTPFLVTELIDGDSLREQMTGEPMNLRQVLDVAERRSRCSGRNRRAARPSPSGR
jgi:hypothetical protein